MKKVFYLSLVCFGLTVFISSCAKKGCTNPNATNFDSSAKSDDGSCTYKGKIVFWYDQTTSNSLVTGGSTSLTYYVDGAVVGSSAATVYFTGAPTCGQSASITVEKDLGVATNKSYSYTVKDDTGATLYSGTANFTANTCTAIQLL